MKLLLVAAVLATLALLACTVDVELGPPGPPDSGFPPIVDADISGLPDSGGTIPDAGIPPDAFQPTTDAL